MITLHQSKPWFHAIFDCRRVPSAMVLFRFDDRKGQRTTVLPNKKENKNNDDDDDDDTR